jgi:Ca2+-binding EF-hand superfamily protein
MHAGECLPNIFQNTTCPLQYLLKKLMKEAPADSKAVSFSEYRKAIRDIIKDSSTVSDEDLRVLFNFSDVSGDGRLSVSEFTNAMHVVDITPRRKDIVRQAFFTIDKHEEKQITLSALMDFFNVNFHPDVTRGLKSEWVVLADVEDYFQESAVRQHLCISTSMEYSCVMTITVQILTCLLVMMCRMMRMDSTRLSHTPCSNPLFSQCLLPSTATTSSSLLFATYSLLPP